MAGQVGVTVTTQRLVGTAGTLRSLNTQLNAKLEEIRQQMNGLSSNWQSEASEEIRANFNKLMPVFEEYRKTVDNYSKFLDQTAMLYEQTESAATSEASNFKL